MRTLDHRGAAPPEVLSPGGTQPGDPRVVGATERASFPQAGRIAIQSVSQPGETGSDPVPLERFDMSQWMRATVNIDYHIAFDGNFYSVPYTLVQQLVEVRSTPTTVEIFHKGTRIASHLRDRRRGQAVTQNEHRPKSHQAHLEWTPSRMANWARSIGPNTAQLFERILNAKPHPEMGYRSCLGIIRLAQQYSAQRVEAAAERALLAKACRYQSVKSILKNSLDMVPLSPPPPGSPPLTHDNGTGARTRRWSED